MYNKEIKKYAKEVKQQCESNVRKNKQNRVKFWDFPSCVSICYGILPKVFVKGYSHIPNGTIWYPVLNNELNHLGRIGSVIGNCSNILGACAEQHSGNNYMKETHENHLKVLKFSATIRPRTGQIILPCDNCKMIFPNLK